MNKTGRIFILDVFSFNMASESSESIVYITKQIPKLDFDPQSVNFIPIIKRQLFLLGLEKEYGILTDLKSRADVKVFPGDTVYLVKNYGIVPEGNLTEYPEDNYLTFIKIDVLNRDQITILD